MGCYISQMPIQSGSSLASSHQEACVLHFSSLIAFVPLVTGFLNLISAQFLLR